jgi:hypothetical protein
MGTRDNMRELKGPPESGNSTEYGEDTLAETEGPEVVGNDNCMCMCMGGATWARGVQGAGAVWAGAWVGALPWGPLVQLLRALEHWWRQSMHRASHVCPIALQLHTGCCQRHAYG